MPGALNLLSEEDGPVLLQGVSIPKFSQRPYFITRIPTKGVDDYLFIGVNNNATWGKGVLD